MQSQVRLLVVTTQRKHLGECAVSELKSFVNQLSLPLSSTLCLPNTASHLITHRSFPQFPYINIQIPADLIPSLISLINNRSIFIKYLVDVYTQANSFENLLSTLSHNPQIQNQKKNHMEQSYFMHYDSFHKNIPVEEMVQKYREFDPYFLSSKLDRKSPDRSYLLAELYSFEKDILQVYFGKVLFRREKDYHYIYRINNRACRGRTSTTHDIAFLMGNMAQLDSYQYIYDPFLGSGSLLLPAGHFGAVCFGSEIDNRVIDGSNMSAVNEGSLLANFRQYGMPEPQVVQMDFMVNAIKQKGQFDAILTDPPFGFAVKPISTSQSKKNSKGQVIAIEKLSVEQIITQLFSVSDKLLRAGGRLVFLFPQFPVLQPGTQNANILDSLPEHPHFELFDYAENYLNKEKSRYILTYVKNE